MLFFVERSAIQFLTENFKYKGEEVRHTVFRRSGNHMMGGSKMISKANCFTKK